LSGLGSRVGRRLGLAGLGVDITHREAREAQSSS
jgi:hypothetical protein